MLMNAMGLAVPRRKTGSGLTPGGIAAAAAPARTSLPSEWHRARSVHGRDMIECGYKSQVRTASPADVS